MILEAQAASQERLCRCGCRATSELSYADNMQGQQNASPASLTSGTPPLSPPTDQSYQTPPMEQVTELVPVPEDVQLPSPNSSEEEAIPIPPPRALTPGRLVSGQRCWTRHKTDEASGSGAARLFQSSTGIRGKACAQPYPFGLRSSVRGSGSWRVRAGQHEDAPERGAPPPWFFNDRVRNIPLGIDSYGWKAVSVSRRLSIHSRSIPYFPPHHCHCHSLSLPSSLLLSRTSVKSRNPLATILSCV